MIVGLIICVTDAFTQNKSVNWSLKGFFLRFLDVENNIRRLWQPPPAECHLVSIANLFRARSFLFYEMPHKKL